MQKHRSFRSQPRLVLDATEFSGVPPRLSWNSRHLLRAVRRAADSAPLDLA